MRAAYGSGLPASRTIVVANASALFQTMALPDRPLSIASQSETAPGETAVSEQPSLAVNLTLRSTEHLEARGAMLAQPSLPVSALDNRYGSIRNPADLCGVTHVCWGSEEARGGIMSLA